jgi:epoxide hydrolase-like predicted phosphatase
MIMIKATVFDFFGVIYSSPYNTWLKNHGYEREGDFLKISQALDLEQVSVDQFFDTLSTLSGQDKGEIKSEFKSARALNVNVLNMVDNFRSKYKTGLLSNASMEYIHDILVENDILRHFDEVVISGEVGYIKPDKAIFDIMIGRLGCEPKEIIFIDDNLSNIESAKRIGLNAILFENYEKLESDLHDMGLV